MITLADALLLAALSAAAATACNSVEASPLIDHPENVPDEDNVCPRGTVSSEIFVNTCVAARMAAKPATFHFMIEAKKHCESAAVIASSCERPKCEASQCQ